MRPCKTSPFSIVKRVLAQTRTRTCRDVSRVQNREMRSRFPRIRYSHRITDWFDYRYWMHAIHWSRLIQKMFQSSYTFIKRTHVLQASRIISLCEPLNMHNAKYVHVRKCIIAMEQPLPYHPLSVYISRCWKFFESEYESLQLISTTHIPARCSSRKKNMHWLYKLTLVRKYGQTVFFSSIKSSPHWQ